MRNILLVLVCFLGTCVALLSYQLFVANKERKVVIERISAAVRKINDLVEENDFLKTSIRLNHSFDGIGLANNSIMKRAPILFDHSKDAKLVFRFSGQNCRACVDENIELLEELAIEVGRENIILLGKFNSDREFNVFNTLNKHGLNIYHIDNISGSVDTLNYPFYFVWKSDFSSHNFFLPMLGATAFTDQYLSLIKSQYFLPRKASPAGSPMENP